MTDPTAPIRKSSLPSTPPPEWEFHTWFPHPDGGGDMVPGERQRGILVRRCVTWGDWEPVRPDRWADEPETDAAAASAVVSPPTDRAELPAPAAVLAECDTIEADYRDQRDDVAVGARAAVMRIRARAVLPAPADRAAVLTDAERTMLTYALDLAGDQMASRGDEFTDEDRAAMEALRRLAVEAHDTGTQQRPARGDTFEAWLKTQRDAAKGYTDAWNALDDVLDLYRLHADTGTPLGEHVCEGPHCDCPRATQPAPVAQQPAAEVPFVPPAHYRGRDGTAYCVHATPVGPDSCRECRDLAAP